MAGAALLLPANLAAEKGGFPLLNLYERQHPYACVSVIWSLIMTVNFIAQILGKPLRD